MFKDHTALCAAENPANTRVTIGLNILMSKAKSQNIVRNCSDNIIFYDNKPRLQDILLYFVVDEVLSGHQGSRNCHLISGPRIA
jgi:hypothetical protein